jgi:hypothetical protein
MSAHTHALWRGLALFAGAGSLLLTSVLTAGVSSAAEEEEGSNNLSVPALYVGSVGVGAPTCTADDDYEAPSGDKGVVVDGVLEHATYWVQGVALWQADCDIVAAGQLVTPTWGDNLTGAPLKVGTPVRIELGLLGTAPATMNTNSYNVVKLDVDELDRESHYGTLGDFLTVPEVRVWAPGTYSIVSSSGAVIVPEQAMGAEINATGRVVYGEQFTFTTGGTYTVTFESESVNFGSVTTPDHDTAIELVISSTSGGGGNKQGGGGRPDNPGGGGGKKPR